MASIRYALGAGPESDVTAAAGDFSDWRALLEIAEAHGLLPLAAGCFDACGVRPPADVESALTAALRQNAKRVLVLSQELNRILPRLEAAGVPVLALKGPVSAHALYADPAWREFCDLDLLTPFDRLAEARRVLSACGYEPSGPARTEVPREASLSRFTEISLENAENGVHVDLHWELTPKAWYASMPAGLWERTRTVSIGGHAVRTLGEEDTFLHFCIHGAKHGWSSLSWLVDLCSLILRAPGIAERSLKAPGLDAHAARMVRFGLAAASAVIPRDHPLDAPERFRARARAIVDDALSQTPREETLRTRLRFQWSLGGNKLAMSRFLFGRLFIPNQDDWATLAIRNRRLQFLFVPWRLLRITRMLLSSAGKS